VGSALHVAVHRCVASGQADDFAGDGEHDRPIIGVAVAITSLGFNREGAVERELSNVRYPAPTGRSPIQVRWQDPTHLRHSKVWEGDIGRFGDCSLPYGTEMHT
jgi:hypothetical protein